ncbi:hypothetical protein B0T14DRAFT_459648 [Immersiella caudata]|uniref:Zn(2)-C6 fungal-type domain-containing protein n=1 Tax=Immersiella caudata TaxID=314043 RepID=A0AA39WKK0_9PEZI|nr:hypothetical protein B0T14DRAFT_459648 [Immersiella caudata]
MDTAATFAVYPLKRRACAACTTAKAKCSGPLPALQKNCQRCSRLGKECVFQDLPQRRRPRMAPAYPPTYPRTASSSTETSQLDPVKSLETKLEALSAEIAALKQHQQNDSPIPTKALPQHASPNQGTQNGEHGDIISRGWITRDEADHLITTFKQDFTPRFPFVTLSSTETAAHLRKHSPFLFLCVIAISLYNNPPLQQRISEEVRRQLSTRLLFHSERSMDLLRGLLVYSAWYQYFAHQGHGQLYILSQLCVTLVYDLGLPPGCSGNKKPDDGRGTDDNGKRAVLGAFWLSVTTSRILQRPVGLKHSIGLDEWASGFAVGPEYASDVGIQPIIMLQAFAFRIMEAVPDITVREEDAREEKSEITPQAILPFLVELENIKEKVNKYSATAPNIANYINLELFHLETWLSHSPIPEPDSPQLYHNIQLNHQSISQILQIPTSEVYCTPLLLHLWVCTSLTWLGRTLGQLLTTTMSRSTITEAQRVINEAKYLSSADSLSKKFEEAYGGLWDGGVDDHSELGRLLHHIRMLRRTYHWHVKRITGSDLVETVEGLTSDLTGEGWVGDAEAMTIPSDADFDTAGFGDFEAGTWTSINDFLFIDYAGFGDGLPGAAPGY